MSTWDFLKATVLAVLGDNPELLATLISAGWELRKKGREAQGRTTEQSSRKAIIPFSIASRVTIDARTIQIVKKECRHCQDWKKRRRSR